MLPDISRSTFGGAACIFIIASVLFHIVVNRYGRGLTKIPGPYVASLTDFWRLYKVWGRRPELWHLALHEKYGPLVRIGPKTVLIGDSKAVQVVYALNAGYTKSDFYTCQQTVNNKGNRLLTLFTSQDEKFHSKLRRAVSNAYSMSTLVQFEPFVDSTTREFLRQLEKRFADREDESGICDFGVWLQYYAFDIIGELTFSERLGFIEQGKDVDNIIGDLEWFLSYAAVVGQAPFLDRWLMKNPVRLWLGRLGILKSASPVAAFAKKRMLNRENEAEKGASINPDRTDAIQRRDFLSRFLEAHQKDPEFISNDRVHALTLANVFAGSDTTGITLRAIFYNLMRNPSDMKKLNDELAEQEKLGNFSRDPVLVGWNEVRELPFLNAVVKEALRCHPAAGLPLERIVPQRGLDLHGHHIPGGTIVGLNAWVIHRDKTIFGEDADRWRPDRWIEASSEQKRLMENSIFAFGAGARTCIGKNISLLEMYKLVPAILRRFEVDFVDPDKEWKLHNAWFVKQSEFYVRLRLKTKG